jgi:hypothetical protein
MLPCARAVCAAAALLLCAVGAGAAPPELTIVTEVQESSLLPERPVAGRGGAGSHPLIVVTTYLKGAKARREVEGGEVTLYDADAARVYTVDSAAKTYSVRAMKDATRPRGADADTAVLYRMSAKLSLHESKGGETSRTVAGMPAQRYLFSASTGLTPKTLLARGLGAGLENKLNRRQSSGGGQPGEASGNGATKPSTGAPIGGASAARGTARSPQATIEGELWLSGAAALLPPDKNARMLPLFAPPILPDPVFKALNEKLARAGQLPLAARLTVYAPPTGQEAAPPEPVVITTTVRSISKEPLDDALFLVPEGYRRVEPDAD